MEEQDKERPSMAVAPAMPSMPPMQMNTTVLAYLGDAVYEVYIREHVIRTGKVRADYLHRESVRYVRASAQAKIIQELFDSLPEDQQALVKRARNHKSATKPKNADPVEYKWATAFEALAGYLYLAGKQEELTALFENAQRIIDRK